MGIQKMFINGEWVEASTGETFESINPATNELVGTVPNGGEVETNLAIQSAHEAFGGWSSLTNFERADYLKKVHDLILSNLDSLAVLMTKEQGKPLYESKMEVSGSAEQFYYFAEEAKRINGVTLPQTDNRKRLQKIKRPLGVVAAITPWNFPLHIICRKIAAALGAGCTVIVKPSEETPLIALELAKLIEQAEFPRGVVNIITGDPRPMGEVLFSDPRVSSITFTGSTAVGKYILKQCSSTLKRVSLELGGHAPIIVFDDADIDLAIEGTMINKLRNSGQTCVCANRIYVHKNIIHEYKSKLTERMSKIVQGNGSKTNVDIGPLINQDALDKVERHVKDALNKGAKLVCGGKKPSSEELKNGYFYKPTILENINENMDLMKEETFGPVAPILVFENEAELLQKVNNTPNGLAAYFYTNNIEKIIEYSEKLEFGVIGVNDTTPVVSHAPFGGIKESGIGREGGPEGIEEFLEDKFISVRYKK